MFISAIVVIASTWQQPRCTAIKNWRKKMWDIYKFEYHSVVNNDDLMKYSGKWMEVEKSILTDISQS